MLNNIVVYSMMALGVYAIYWFMVAEIKEKSSDNE